MNKTPRRLFAPSGAASNASMRDGPKRVLSVKKAGRVADADRYRDDATAYDGVRDASRNAQEEATTMAKKSAMTGRISMGTGALRVSASQARASRQPARKRFVKADLQLPTIAKCHTQWRFHWQPCKTHEDHAVRIQDEWEYRTSRGKFSPPVKSGGAYPTPASLCCRQGCSAEPRQLSDAPATLDILPWYGRKQQTHKITTTYRPISPAHSSGRHMPLSSTSARSPEPRARPWQPA